MSVEKIDLKGLSHKKNERNVECSFEVRCQVFFPFSPLRGRKETFAMSRYLDCSKWKMGLFAKRRTKAVGGRKPGLGHGRAASRLCAKRCLDWRAQLLLVGHQSWLTQRPHVKIETRCVLGLEAPGNRGSEASQCAGSCTPPS